jgi:Xaa-Pro aminopeptidase
MADGSRVDRRGEPGTEPIGMGIRYDRIERAQALMREQGISAIVVMNHDDYRWLFELIPVVRDAMRPGATVADLDDLASEVLTRHGLGEYQVHGIGHGLGLRFEEAPASTIIPPHRNLPLREGMTLTIGHTILAIPGVGGVRHEDVYRVTSDGGEVLWPYPIEPVLEG